MSTTTLTKHELSVLVEAIRASRDHYAAEEVAQKLLEKRGVYILKGDVDFMYSPAEDATATASTTPYCYNGTTQHHDYFDSKPSGLLESPPDYKKRFWQQDRDAYTNADYLAKNEDSDDTSLDWDKLYSI